MFREHGEFSFFVLLADDGIIEGGGRGGGALLSGLFVRPLKKMDTEFEFAQFSSGQG